MNCFRTLLISAALIPALAEARIEAPDHVIFGNASLFGDPAAPGQLVELKLTDSGEVLTQYELGRDPRLGDQFALRIPMDAVSPQLDGRARPGDPVQIFVGGMLAGETTVGAEGTAVRLDIDPQNLGTGPSISVTDPTVFEGNSGTTPAVFTVSLNTTSDDDVVLFWETEDETATGGAACVDGVDYLADDGQLVMPPGGTGGEVTILVCGDTLIESVETFRLVFVGAQNGVLSRPFAVATIIDDDDVPELRIADVTVIEPAEGTTTQAVFRPRLSKNSDYEARFEYQTVPQNAVPGVDYEPVSGTITIAPGDLEAEIAVTVLNSPGASPPKSFALQISEPFNLGLAREQALGVINDRAFRPAVVPEQDVVNQEDNVTGLAGPTSMAISPDGAHVYATSESLDAVLVFGRNSFNGRLSYTGTYDAARAGFGTALLGGPLHVQVSPDGAHVYVAARNDDSVAVLSRNPSTGALSFVQNQADGALSAPGASVPNSGLAGVRRLLISADGQHLYAAGSDANAVAVFARDETSGELSFLESEISGQDDPDDAGGAVVSMQRPSGLALAADGEHLYVASRFGDAVQVFERTTDPDDDNYGRLAFVTAYENGLAGITGLDGAYDVAISPDDAHLYVTGEADNSVVLFDRQPDGTLVQRRVLRHDSPDRPGLVGPQGLAVSPDGLEVFVTGFADNSLTIFRRLVDDEDNLQVGDLVVRQTVFDDQGGVLFMAGPTAVAPSADDKHLYVVANEDNAIVVFRRISLDIIFSDGFEQP